MNKVLAFSFFITVCFLYACNDDCTPPIIIIEPTVEEVTDSCNGFNLVACSFYFREGKWVEILDSLELQFYMPDTIWFKQDSLIGWTDQSSDYTFYVGYFRSNLLYKQSWSTEPNDPVSSSGIHTEYDEATELFRINWASGTKPRDYERVD
jgi:hypothetical protein